MLGYEVDFGMEQVKKLLGGATFAEKVAGYMAVSVLVGQQDESMGAVCAAIREDLRSPLDSVQCMALSAIANKGGKRMGAALAPDVREKTFSVAAFPPVRRRAALALLRVFRVDPDYLPLPEYSPQVLKLLDDRDVSVKMAGLLLLTGVAPKALDSFASAYHHTNAPWFQVQCLRFLQLFPRPSEAGVDSILCETLEKILNGTKITRSVNRNNADHAELFEAVNLIIKYGEESETSMRNLAMQHLTRFINIKEPNIR
ncbi:ALPHA-ADR, partial [Symbiodinium sp. KB8]